MRILQELKARIERELRAPEDINIDATWDRLMTQNGVNTDAVTVPIEIDHGHRPQRGIRRHVI